MFAEFTFKFEVFDAPMKYIKSLVLIFGPSKEVGADIKFAHY